MICPIRMRRDQRTKEYVALGAPPAKPGKSKREIIRCLKRYVAREAYRVVAASPPTTTPLDRMSVTSVNKG